MGKKSIRVTACVAMAAASLLALSIAPSEASTPTATTCSEPRGEKPIVFDRQAPEQPIVDVSSELMAKDAKSKGYDVSDEEWREESSRNRAPTPAGSNRRIRYVCAYRPKKVSLQR